MSVHALPGFPLGKRNVKDPRLDQADRLVEAKKKVYAQVDAVGEEGQATADALVTSSAGFPDLLLQDLEFIENRLGRDPGDEEKAVLGKLQVALEAGTPVGRVDLTPNERAAIAAHQFLTAKPVIVATAAEETDPDSLILRAYREAGFISFLTVGGKENRAWTLPAGATAWEAAGTIHTDIQKGFIRAEIIRFDELVAAGGETEAKRAGKQRLETKSYVMEDFDVTNFRFNK